MANAKLYTIDRRHVAGSRIVIEAIVAPPMPRDEADVIVALLNAEHPNGDVWYTRKLVK